MKKIGTLLMFIALMSLGAFAQAPKHEFRGVWMPTVTGEYYMMGEKEMKAKLIAQLEEMKKAGMNAVLFQIRPEADAWYHSDFEPWSRLITGTQGKDPGWDPTAFMIEECHKRSMEFHAWINPYRVKTSPNTVLDKRHIYFRHPEYFFEYGGQLFFDPSRVESQDFICNVVRDIITKYDVDAIHMDDYFYPYPKPGLEIPDEVSFRAYSRGFANIEDWRRDNVNKLIRKIHETIKDNAPWVQFGISPFGIYRNESSDPKGSKTRGLQNYDDLYADVLLWAKKGWVDYLIPQIYWEMGHPAADYCELLDWWSENVSRKCRVYVGQDVLRTSKPAKGDCQLKGKFDMMRENENIDGYCLYPIKQVINNPANFTDNLKAMYNVSAALPPVFDRYDRKHPDKVKDVEVVETSDGPVLFWTPRKEKNELEQAVKYCVYMFDKKKHIDLDDTSALLTVTTKNYVKLPDMGGKVKCYYVITAVDRFNNESKKVIKKVKL